MTHDYNGEQLKQLVISAIKECSYSPINPEDLHNETLFISDLLFDSITYIEMIVTLEEALGIEMDDTLLLFDDSTTFSGFLMELGKYLESMNI